MCKNGDQYWVSAVMTNTFNSICEKCEFCVKIRFLSLLYLLLSLNHLIRTFFWLNKNSFMNFFAILKYKKMLCYKFQKLWMCSLQHPILLLHNYIAVDTRHFIFFIHFFLPPFVNKYGPQFLIQSPTACISLPMAGINGPWDALSLVQLLKKTCAVIEVLTSRNACDYN